MRLGATRSSDGASPECGGYRSGSKDRVAKYTSTIDTPCRLSNQPLQQPNATRVRSNVSLCRDAAGCARGSSRPWYVRRRPWRSLLNGRSLATHDGRCRGDSARFLIPREGADLPAHHERIRSRTLRECDRRIPVATPAHPRDQGSWPIRLRVRRAEGAGRMVRPGHRLPRLGRRPSYRRTRHSKVVPGRRAASVKKAIERIADLFTDENYSVSRARFQDGQLRRVQKLFGDRVAGRLGGKTRGEGGGQPGVAVGRTASVAPLPLASAAERQYRSTAKRGRSLEVAWGTRRADRRLMGFEDGGDDPRTGDPLLHAAALRRMCKRRPPHAARSPVRRLADPRSRVGDRRPRFEETMATTTSANSRSTGSGHHRRPCMIGSRRIAWSWELTR